MSKLAILMTLVLGALGAQGEAKKATYALVINSNNKTTETGDAAKATIKKLFLKEMTQWSGGVEAKPYAREGTAPEQVAFLKDVLGMSDAELARHWLKMKNMNGTTPPKDVDSDRMILKYVAKTDGAFGVVKLDAAKGAEGVKVLFEF
jgi:ABC-type phosphate transport system substrate-binding protein